VASVHQALTLLGTVAVRRWATLLVLAGISDRPHHLLTLAMQRARMCEQIAAHFPGADADRAFTAGLFSVLDALLGTPMRELVDELPFDERMRSALLDGDGPEGEVLSAALAYEKGAFDATERHGIELAAVADAYRDALRWAREAADQL
jgi:EAL and modified HD-GYP domain-containing signal transduction protein